MYSGVVLHDNIVVHGVLFVYYNIFIIWYITFGTRASTLGCFSSSSKSSWNFLYNYFFGPLQK
jgi:hypothetical protein